MTIQELYRTRVRYLKPDERLQLARWILDDLADEKVAAEPVTPPRRRSLMELHGLGKEIWQDVDVDAYVNALRDDWDRP